MTREQKKCPELSVLSIPAVLNTGHGAVLHLHPQSAAALLTGEQTAEAQSASEQGLFWGLGCLL